MNTNLMIVVIAQIFGIISWLLLIYSYTKEDIDDLLYIQIMVCLFDVISYLLLGADAGLLICLLELIKTILYYKTDKDKLIFRFGLIAYFLIGLLTIRHWYALLPVVGSIIDSFGTSKDSKLANICSIISNTLWTIYDVLILSYIGALSDIVVVICNISILLFGYSRLMRISKFRIIKETSLSKKTVDKIYNLDLKNLGEDNTWDKKYQLDIFKKNKDSMFIIKYHDSFVGYINYLNISEDDYLKLKRKRTMPDLFDLNAIFPFKANKKSFLVIESINVKKEYEKNETIDLISKKIGQFIKQKHRQRIYIHGILGYALTDFQKKIYEKMGYTKLKELDDNIYLFELFEDEIKKKL